MEFNKKLQELRRRRGLTQDELARVLFVSRTAVSKWESGKGYPGIDSLKQIAKFFSVTIDELLSTEEVLTLAEEDEKRREASRSDLIYGIIDASLLLLLFLPLFADRSADAVRSVSLLSLESVRLYLRVLYFVSISASVVLGILTLALQNSCAAIWMTNKRRLSLLLGAVITMLFILTLQPYPALFSLLLLAIKATVLIKPN